MRVRFALAVAVSSLVVTLGGAIGGSVEPVTVAWPPSSGLLLGEVATGGASASDEFVEIYNAASVPLDLGGLELAYSTASGSTVTSKASWGGGTMLAPGGHLLVANGVGAFASLADALYSGGLAATGGALVLRPIGGIPIDAIAWGDSTNAFVEGRAAAAPSAGQSLERRPGGLGGNGEDTNDNALDLFVSAAPSPQGLAAPPVPAPIATEEPSPTPEEGSGSWEPEPGGSGEPRGSADPSGEPTAGPTGAPSPTLSPSPSPASTATPSPASTTSPASSATPASTSGVLTVAEARAQPNGRVVEVVATLTTPVGLVEGGTGAFVQDLTGGISLYLASADWPALQVGTVVRVHGSVDDRFAQRTIRLASRADITATGGGEGPPPGAPPLPEEISTGAAGEAFEGQLVTVVARVVTSPSTLSDGFAVTVDDGSGQLRVVATGASGVGPTELPSQDWFRLSGPLGQRDSSGTGTQGYRMYLRSPLDVEPVVQPTPPVTASASPMASSSPTSSPEATAGPSPAASPTTAPTASPTATPVAVLGIAAARTLSVGSAATVEGVATVEAGRILDERTVVLQDASGGIAVRLPAGGWPAFARGDLLRVRGTLAQPYGNLELRPSDAAAVTVLGPGALPAARITAASELGEALEGRLVRASGVVVVIGSVGTSGNFSVDLEDGSGPFRVFVYGATGIARNDFSKGASVEVTGIAGQRASSSGAPDGHRIWPRERRDLATGTYPAAGGSPSAGASPGTTASGSPGPGGSGASGAAPIATAIANGGSATVEGTVTTPPGLVDADGRRVAIEDTSGAILVRLPAGAAALGVGTRIAATGKLGTYYGSPQLELAEAPVVAGQGSLAPRMLGAVPGPELGWRLVRVAGVVTKVQRLGAAWRAELSVGGQEVPVYGAARAGIASTALVEGRAATVTGVVRPPYPTATDRRPAVMPRFGKDVALGGAAGPGAGGSAAGDGAGGAGGVGGGEGGAGAGAIDVDLAELSEHEGALVRVGGLVVSAVGSRVVIEDGGASAAVLLPPDAAGIGADLRPGDALNATGTVVADGEGWAVAPRTAVDLARVGRLGELVPLVKQTAAPDADPVLAADDSQPGGWPIDPLPTAVALAGTGATVLLRRRDVLELGRRLVAVVLGHLGRA